MSGKILISVKERFDKKWIAVPESGCWIWEAGEFADGYGLFWDNEIQMNDRAPRVSWKLYKGKIPPDCYVLHHCDVPLCVNPEHLFLGTPLMNTHDMIKKKRHGWKEISQCPKGHPYTPDNLRKAYNRTVHSCLTCHREREHKRYWDKRNHVT